MTTHNPLAGPPPAEVHLPHAPLVKVVAQVRFPRILSIEKSEFVANFQEAIRSDYPTLNSQRMHQFLIGPSNTIGEAGKLSASTIWKFSSEDEGWIVTLAPDSVGFETSIYSTRNDFLKRFRLILSAIADHISPGHAERIGMRYLDRVTGSSLKKITALTRPEVHGVLSSELSEAIEHSLTESIFTAAEEQAQVIARWGVLPARGTIDPSLLPPIDEAGWVLDLDIYSEQRRLFDAEKLVETFEAYSKRSYSLFRWITNDEFLREFEGKP